MGWFSLGRPGKQDLRLATQHGMEPNYILQELSQKLVAIPPAWFLGTWRWNLGRNPSVVMRRGNAALERHLTDSVYGRLLPVLSRHKGTGLNEMPWRPDMGRILSLNEDAKTVYLIWPWLEETWWRGSWRWRWGCRRYLARPARTTSRGYCYTSLAAAERQKTRLSSSVIRYWGL